MYMYTILLNKKGQGLIGVVLVLGHLLCDSIDMPLLVCPSYKGHQTSNHWKECVCLPIFY